MHDETKKLDGNVKKLCDDRGLRCALAMAFTELADNKNTTP
jgi:hypothetical protein